jgi:serine/threonine-protein kinase
VRQGEFVKGQPLPGTRYRVLDLVGVGGMGSVYEVEHVELGKRFVLKALLSDLALREDLVARLRNEWRALGRLEHPNIVNVTDAGATSGNVPFFVMERLDGETLAQRLKRDRRLSPVDALRVALGVLEGLSAAHEIGVVHRDVKPPNIFLAAGNRPKILDFGVAKIADAGSAITARGVAVGTPRYMSPEQASGEPVDGRSDLYAVGLLLHEMIAGKGPFDDARDANEMLLSHLGRVPPQLASVAPGVTPELAALVQELLAKDPGDRPPNARTAAARVRALVRSYGASVSTDAPTPFASDPLSFAEPTALPADTAGVGETQELPTQAAGARPRPASDNDTLIDDRGTTLSGEVTYGTRTELLSAIAPPASGATETHTRLPVTPPDGGATLDPLPMESRAPSVPPSPRGRLARTLAIAAVVLLSLLVLTLVLASRSREDVGQARGSQRNPEAAAPPSPVPATAAEAPALDQPRSPPPIARSASASPPTAASAPASLSETAARARAAAPATTLRESASAAPAASSMPPPDRASSSPPALPRAGLGSPSRPSRPDTAIKPPDLKGLPSSGL